MSGGELEPQPSAPWRRLPTGPLADLRAGLAAVLPVFEDDDDRAYRDWVHVHSRRPTMADGEGSFACRVCGAEFKTSAAASAHEATCTNTRPPER